MNVGEVLVQVPKYLDGVLVGPVLHILGLLLGLLNDSLSVGARVTHDGVLIDQDRHLLAGFLQQTLRLFLCFGKDAAAILLHPSGGLDLFGDGDTQLVYDLEEFLLIDDYARR